MQKQDSQQVEFRRVPTFRNVVLALCIAMAAFGCVSSEDIATDVPCNDQDPSNQCADGESAESETESTDSENDSLESSTETGLPESGPYFSGALFMTRPDGWRYEVQLRTPALDGNWVEFSKVIENSPPGQAQLAATPDSDIYMTGLSAYSATEGRNAPEIYTDIQSFFPSSFEEEDQGLNARFIGPDTACRFTWDALVNSDDVIYAGLAQDFKPEVRMPEMTTLIPGFGRFPQWRGVSCDLTPEIPEISALGMNGLAWTTQDESKVDALVSELNAANDPILVGRLLESPPGSRAPLVSNSTDNSCTIYYFPDGSYELGGSFGDNPDCVISES